MSGKIIADLSIFPIGLGTSVGDAVGKAYQALKSTPEVRLEPGGMATVIEADTLDQIWLAVKNARDAVREAGGERIYFTLRVDERLDVAASVEHKVGRLR